MNETETQPETEIDESPTQHVTDDLDRCIAAIDLGDRMLHRADNLADRSEFVEAKAAMARTAGRLTRLLAYYETTAPSIATDEFLAEMTRHVGASLEREWEPVEEADDEG